MHWWQSAFTSSSKSHSDDDSVIVAGGASRHSLKPRFFSSRWSRSLTRSRKLRHVGKDDADSWRSPSYYEDSPSRSASASPQPLPLPELHVLLRRDPKFASSSSNGVPLPSPDSIQSQRRGFEEKQRERQTFSENAMDGFNGFKRLACQETRRNVGQPGTQSSRKSPQKQNAKGRSSKSYYINVPISAPTSPYSSPILSPPNSDMLATYYMTPPSIFHVWSAPEMPHSDGNVGLSLNHQMPSERTASSVDNSPLQSPRLSSSLHAPSPPRPASPLPTKISSDASMGRWESNTQPTVHPLPLPPGAGMASQPTPISPVASTSDFPGAFQPSQPTPISVVAAKPEFAGANIPAQPLPVSQVANIPAQPSPISQVASNPELMPIKTQWRKGKLIGRGTFGSVYVAYNRDTGALCAMKEVEILLDDSKSSESMKQLEQEIKVLSNLKHPNIVQYYGSEIVADKFYIYLEYVHPGSINKFIHDHCGGITESIVRNFTRHILCGLAYLHSTKTIHRDIKGANLLVDAYGVVKLADFGMSKHLNGSMANLSLKGSPYWLAPELLQSVMQKDGSSDLALAVDIWSLGCTIIEMMNGKPPWSEYEGAAALFKVLKESPPIPETLSADGKDFLQCCFRRNPADRPTASKLLDHPFVNYLQQPDACTQSFKAIRLTDNIPVLRERPCYKFNLVPASLHTQIKKEKLARR